MMFYFSRALTQYVLSHVLFSIMLDLCLLVLFFYFSFHCVVLIILCIFFFSSRRRHTRCLSDWSSDVCSSDLGGPTKHSTGVRASFLNRRTARNSRIRSLILSSP